MVFAFRFKLILEGVRQVMPQRTLKVARGRGRGRDSQNRAYSSYKIVKAGIVDTVNGTSMDRHEDDRRRVPHVNPEGTGVELYRVALVYLHVKPHVFVECFKLHLKWVMFESRQLYQTSAVEPDVHIRYTHRYVTIKE